ncbi:MAG TPA: VWD domain-containing protein [Roseiarcus sp.]
MSNGNIVFGYQRSDNGSLGTQVFTVAGAAVGTEQVIASTGTAYDIDVAASSSGGYMVAYAPTNSDNNSDYKIFNNSNVLQSSGTAFTDTDNGADPEVVALSNGDYLYIDGDNAFNGNSLSGKIYTPAGAVVGSVTLPAYSFGQIVGLNGASDPSFVAPVPSSTYDAAISGTSNFSNVPDNLAVESYTGTGTDSGPTQIDTGTAKGIYNSTSSYFTTDTAPTYSLSSGLNGGLIEVDSAPDQNTGSTSTITVRLFDWPGAAQTLPPTVTAANISLSGGTGAGGDYRIGDTVTATWNDSASGDNNSASITGVTFDFSQFGGGTAVVASDSGGVWTATYTITAGSIDAANRNVVVTATDSAGSTTTSGATNVTVDDKQPIVTAAQISLAGASGTGGAFKIGDTVTATWNDSGTGDNNTDTINAGGVTFNFSQFGGGSAVVASNSGGVWTATYTIAAGAIDTSAAHVAVTATDHAGNATTTSGGAVTVDDKQPVVTTAHISVTGGSGAGGAFKIGDTVTASWNDSGTGDNNTDAINAGGVTFNFSQFGGGAAVVASNSGGVWTATYTIATGGVDTSAAHVAVTATDHVGNATTTSGGAVTVDDKQPVVTAANISVTGASGAGGAFKIGDTVTATWNDSGTGDNNTDTINAGGVTFNFSQFGGGAAVVASNSGGVWTATYTIAAGGIDTNAAQVAVTATDHVGNATTASGGAAAVDDERPIVTAANISVSGGSGAGGAFKIGDVVTATWNDSGTGDNNTDTINAGGVTFNFSQFGGGAAVVASDSGGVWTATYTIAAGGIDASTAQVAVTATDHAGNATTISGGAVAVDDEQPIVTAANISVSGGSGVSGAFKIGDTVTASWNDSGTGDNNTDTIDAGGVTFDFSQFGGGSAVVASDSGGVWTATYTIAAGSVDTSAAQVAVTATDHAGNATTIAGGAVTVDDEQPVVTAANIGVTGGSGTGGAFKIGDTVTASWNDSGTGDNNTDTIDAGGVTFDFSQFGGGSAVVASDNGGVWTATYTIAVGGVDTSAAHVAVTATDHAGNATTTASGVAVAVDDEQPIVTAANISVTGGSGAGGAFRIGDTVTATWNDSGTGDNNTDTIDAGGVTFDFSQFGGGSAVVARDSGGDWTATYTIAAGAIDTATAHIEVTATDAAGNVTTTAGGPVAVDDVAVAPTITGVVAGQTTTSEAALNPFANVSIGDDNPGATETLTISLSGSGGTLSGAGLSGGSGSYTLSGSAAAVTTELDALSFTATAGAPGTSGTTTFTLSDASSDFATPTVNFATTVTDVDPTGTGWGDVHMVTFQGLHYDFQAVGDFTLVKGTTSADPFDVEIRTSPWASMISVTTEIAAQVGGNAVQFDLDGTVKLNGAVDTSLGSVNAVQAIDGGTITRTAADSYVVDWASGESLNVTNAGPYFNETVTLSAKDGPGSVQGLLGSNTSQATDIQLANGTVLDAPTDSQLLGVYAESWSVADSASLLNDNTSLPLAMSNDGNAATPFNGRSFMDLAGLSAASATLSFHENASGAFGTLSVQSGAQQTAITLLGQYAAAGFGVVSDGHGGTIVDYAPPKLTMLG